MEPVLMAACLVLGLGLGFVLGRRRSGPVTPEEDLQSVEEAVARQRLEDEQRSQERQQLVDERDQLAAQVEQQQQEIEGLGEAEERLKGRMGDLENEIRRNRRWAGEQLDRLSGELEGLWERAALPRRIHELEALEEQPDEELRAALQSKVEEVRQLVDRFDLATAGIEHRLGLWRALDQRLEKAVACFQRAARQEGSAESWLALGECLWRLERPQKACAAYEHCLGEAGIPEHIYQRYAEVSIAERRYRKGLKALEHLLAADSVPAEVFALASFAHGKLKEHERALEICETGLEHHPDSAVLMANMIIPLGRLERYEEAEEVFARTSELDPELAEAPFAMAVVCMDQDEHDRAVDHLRQALALDGKHAESHLCMGVILNRRGEFKQALAHLQQAVEQRPDYAEAYYNMKESYEGLRDFENAIAVLNRAVQLNPDYQ